MVERVTGTVKFFNESKGYGFIESGGRDVFVHRRDLPAGIDALSQAQRVTFIVGESDRKGKGVKATLVQIE